MSDRLDDIKRTLPHISAPPGDLLWLIAEVERLRAANRALIEERDAAVERQTVVDAEVELLRHDLQVQIRYSNRYAEAHARKFEEVERLRAEQAEFRRKIEAMPNTIISRRAKRHVLAALGGERDA